MALVVAALLPVFLLIVLGFVLKRSLLRLETQWHGLERLTYYVLFPVLLVQTLVKADLATGAGRRCRRRAAARGAADVAAVPRPAAAAGAMRDRRAGLYLDLPGRHPLADLCGALGLRQSLWRHRTGAGFRGDGRDHPAGQCLQRRRAGALRLARKAIGSSDRHDRGEQSPDLGLRHRACAQCRCTCRCRASGTRSPTRSAAPRSRSACWSREPACSWRECFARASRPASPFSSSWS